MKVIVNSGRRFGGDLGGNETKKGKTREIGELTNLPSKNYEK